MVDNRVGVWHNIIPGGLRYRPHPQVTAFMGIFSFLKRQKASRGTQPLNQPELDSKLGRTRSRFRDNLLDFMLGNKPINADLLEELESQLIMADVGIDATARVMSALNNKVSRSEVGDSEALRGALREELVNILRPVEQPLEIPDGAGPFVILVVGVNGSGKTTTIGKLARQLKDGGKSVMLAAGDTFRAAAVEQLKTWGERNGVPVVSQGSGADSASVIFDALQSAQARGIDVLIADTAGRLHTQTGLMQELEKIKRVLSKLDTTAPQETLIVLDGGTGQNALSQAMKFHESMGLSGMVITKLDGTAKGGVVFSIAESMGLPIRFIGVGEQVADLEVFEAERYVDALISVA
ncbi:MAG: signal recognition particle-docking protein FtsY [Granulosicoccus sp.]